MTSKIFEVDLHTSRKEKIFIGDHKFNYIYFYSLKQMRTITT